MWFGGTPGHNSGRLGTRGGFDVGEREAKHRLPPRPSALLHNAHGSLLNPAHGTLSNPAHGTLSNPAHGTLSNVFQNIDSEVQMGT